MLLYSIMTATALVSKLCFEESCCESIFSLWQKDDNVFSKVHPTVHLFSSSIGCRSSRNPKIQLLRQCCCIAPWLQQLLSSKCFEEQSCCESMFSLWQKNDNVFNKVHRTVHFTSIRCHVSRNPKISLLRKCFGSVMIATNFILKNKAVVSLAERIWCRFQSTRLWTMEWWAGWEKNMLCDMVHTPCAIATHGRREAAKSATGLTNLSRHLASLLSAACVQDCLYDKLEIPSALQEMKNSQLQRKKLRHKGRSVARTLQFEGAVLNDMLLFTHTCTGTAHINACVATLAQPSTGLELSLAWTWLSTTGKHVQLTAEYCSTQAAAKVGIYTAKLTCISLFLWVLKNLKYDLTMATACALPPKAEIKLFRKVDRVDVDP